LANQPTTPRLLFRSAQHLRSPADFRRVYREGNRARGELMTVAVRENDLGTVRLGLSVGKVTWKSAVRRNRVRRIFREAFRLEQAELPASHDIVLISGPKIRPELAAARTELVRLAKKAARRYREKLAEQTLTTEPPRPTEPASS